MSVEAALCRLLVSVRLPEGVFSTVLERTQAGWIGQARRLPPIGAGGIYLPFFLCVPRVLWIESLSFAL